jgi:hypothetical protein
MPNCNAQPAGKKGRAFEENYDWRTLSRLLVDARRVTTGDQPDSCKGFLTPEMVISRHHIDTGTVNLPPKRCGKLPLRLAQNMALSDSQNDHVSEIDAALLDAELFLKYKSIDRAVKRLRTALERNSRSILLRERLREVCGNHKQPEEAARQCLALASLYIEREDFDTAHDRLLEAKQFDQRINIATGLEAIRRARRPDLKPTPAAEPTFTQRHFTLAGDLSAVSVFDAIQVIENARLTGSLRLTGQTHEGCVMFNDGRIIDAESAGDSGEAGFRRVVEINSGTFEFQKSPKEFAVKIQALSNTNLILDTLRLLDESKLS